MNQNYLNTFYNPEWVYTKIKNYFCIEEFYRKEVIDFMKSHYPKTWEAKLWSYLEFRNISNLLWMRINLNRKITINNWKWGGKYTGRGVRDNKHYMTLAKDEIYLSAHLRFAGTDYQVEDMIAEEVRRFAVYHSKDIPYNIRFEHRMKKGIVKVSWVHQDSNYEIGKPKVYLFSI